MAIPQTDYVNKEYILHGACKLEVSEDGSTWVNAGGLNGVKITENLQVSKQETDNIADEYNVTDQTATIEAEQIEYFNENVREIIRSTLDTVTNTAAAEVEGAEDVTASGDWSFNKFIPFTYQMYDGSQPTINSVTGSEDSTLALNTDYFIMKYGGVWGYYVIDSATVTTESQSLTVDTDYTPAASRTITSGGYSEIPEFQVRITNYDPNVGSAGRTVYWQFYRCQLGKGVEIEFKKYNDEDDRVANPISFNALLDTSRSAGDQLYKQYDDEPIS